MGTWNWVYFFGSGSNGLSATSVIDLVVEADTFVRFESGAMAVAVLDGSDGEREYRTPVEFDEDLTGSVRRLLQEGEHFQTGYLRHDLPIQIAFATGASHPEIRKHIAVGWLARSLNTLGQDGVHGFRDHLHGIMRVSGASYAIGVSEPPDNIEDKLVEIDGVDVFDNTNWRGRPYEISFVWVNESHGVGPPEGIEVGPGSVSIDGIVEYRCPDG